MVGYLKRRSELQLKTQQRAFIDQVADSPSSACWRRNGKRINGKRRWILFISHVYFMEKPIEVSGMFFFQQNSPTSLL